MEQQNENRKLELGSTIGSAFALIRDFPIKVIGLAFVLGAVPTRALYYGLSGVTNDAGSTVLTSVAVLLVGLVIQVVLAGLLVGSAAHQEAGIGSGLRRLPQLIVGGLLNALGSCIALMCLLIPYLFVMTRWSVVGAVLANEDRGISEAFGRSSELTEGVRLHIFGLIVLSGIGQILFVTIGLLLVAPVTGMATALQDFSSNPVALAMRTFVETCTIGFAAALQCALYVALRESREGPMSDYLTEIFA